MTLEDHLKAQLKITENALKQITYLGPADSVKIATKALMDIASIKPIPTTVISVGVI